MDEEPEFIDESGDNYFAIRINWVKKFTFHSYKANREKVVVVESIQYNFMNIANRCDIGNHDFVKA